jgi:Glycosyl hydrolase family 20, catalytic domain
MKKALVWLFLVLLISRVLVAAPTKIVGFHIDMNIAQFKGEYLKECLERLAGLGYNTILWEVENNIRWETCPECVSPDAFSKEEFKGILSFSRALGLEPIPLLQTIGHCEYVLKNEKYRHLAELPGRIDQYCPRNPEVVSFLKRWIDEYLEVFGNVRYFHLGADEAYALGECPRCRAYAEKNSLSELYISHVNTLSRPLTDKGIRPIIWGDMILHHPEALDHLSRKIVIFDWLYDRYVGCGQVNIWGQGNRGRDELDAMTLERFGRFLFPLGDEPGRDPDPFYTAAFLQDRGFDVVLCPSSSSYGDSIYAPRTYFHMRNTADSFRQAVAEGRLGAVLTSWTVHLFPWELQETSIELPPFILRQPGGDLADYEKAYVREHFGVEDARFFAAAGRLAKRGLFNYAADLGFYKDAKPAPKDYIVNRLDELAKSGTLEKEAEACRARLEEYRRGWAEFREYGKTVAKGQKELGFWDLAARNLINRAEAALVLLKDKSEGNSAGTRREAGRVLDDLRRIRQETEAAYSTQIKPRRTKEIMQWMYDSMETALEKAAGRSGGAEKEKPKENGTS